MSTAPVLRNSPTTCVVTCKQCGQRTTLGLAQLQDCYTLPVTCACGHVTRLVRERRRFERKAVKLAGELVDIRTQVPLAKVNLLDLSLGGVRFVSHQRDVKMEDRFTLIFRLDDACQTTIREDIVVRNVTDSQHVGAEFLCKETYNFELDFYLTPYTIRL